MRLTSSDMPAFDAYQHKAQTSLAEIVGLVGEVQQAVKKCLCCQVNGQLWVVAVHIVGTPCFIVLVKFWHRLRALHVHICCFQAVARTRRHVDNTTVQNTDRSLTLENFGLVDRIESTKKTFQSK